MKTPNPRCFGVWRAIGKKVEAEKPNRFSAKCAIDLSNPALRTKPKSENRTAGIAPHTPVTGGCSLVMAADVGYCLLPGRICRILSGIGACVGLLPLMSAVYIIADVGYC
jgi:hypothetical protein